MTGHHIDSYLARVTTSPNISPRLYEIRVGGHLDARWAASFEAMTLARYDDGSTVLRGSLPDQTALHGVLTQLRDAGLPLLSVAQLDEGTAPVGRMKAAVYRRFGGPEVVRIEEVDRPAPAAGELLVRVATTTVSAADHRTRSRDVPPGLLLPSSLVLGFFRPRRPILGMDVAGTVVAVGEGVDGFAPCDEVVAMLGSRFGGHAEYAIVKMTDAVAVKPAGMPFDEAVAHVFGGITARAYLRQADIRPGTRVLVNGASGAVGAAVVQLAKAAGAHVTGVSSAANHPLVTSLGADRVIDYATEDFATDGSSYDVVVDCVGNAPVSRVRNSLAPDGSVLLVAANLGSLLAARGQARRLGIRVITGPGPYRADDLEHVLALAAEGALRPVIDRTFPLDQIAAAHRFVDSGRKRGGVVVTIPST
jgi:NADPH:quinone reductase-like Zn-dependent oxidoreductase